jgi:hypothetical protein
VRSDVSDACTIAELRMVAWMNSNA